MRKATEKCSMTYILKQEFYVRSRSFSLHTKPMKNFSEKC